MKTLRICMAGLGNVGRKFLELLSDKQGDLRHKFDTEILLTGVCTRTNGLLLDPDGLDIKAVLLGSKGKPGAVFDMLELAAYDAFLELTTLAVNDGQPATDYIRKAMTLGKQVISANKGPVANHYAELSALARERGVRYLFETAVLDGAPVFNMYQNCLRGCQVISLSGIFNTTSNFVLGKMEQGYEAEAAIKEAQVLGFAESDPGMDMDGWDGTCKLCALANVFMDAQVNPALVRRDSITPVSHRDIEQAQANGCRIKYVCRAGRIPGGFSLTVKPETVGRDNPFYWVSGTSNSLTIETDLTGSLTLLETDPGIKETAYGVYSDLLTLIHLMGGQA